MSSDSGSVNDEPTGHCVLCTPASHGNRDEADQIPMSMEVDGEVLEADVRVCEPHRYVIKRVLEIENDRYDPAMLGGA